MLLKYKGMTTSNMIRMYIRVPKIINVRGARTHTHRLARTYAHTYTCAYIDAWWPIRISHSVGHKQGARISLTVQSTMATLSQNTSRLFGKVWEYESVGLQQYNVRGYIARHTDIHRHIEISTFRHHNRYVYTCIYVCTHIHTVHTRLHSSMWTYNKPPYTYILTYTYV